MKIISKEYVCESLCMPFTEKMMSEQQVLALQVFLKELTTGPQGIYFHLPNKGMDNGQGPL